MLVQHLLTERLFRTIFDNPEFVRRKRRRGRKWKTSSKP